jgi:hypothetical protein
LYLSGRGDGPIRVGVADEREVNAQRAPWCVICGGVAADRAGHDVGAGRHEAPSDQETGADHITRTIEHPHNRCGVDILI